MASRPLRKCAKIHLLCKQWLATVQTASAPSSLRWLHGSVQQTRTRLAQIRLKLVESSRVADGRILLGRTWAQPARTSDAHGRLLSRRRERRCGKLLCQAIWL